jgi:hypothetical protein
VISWECSGNLVKGNDGIYTIHALESFLKKTTPGNISKNAIFGHPRHAKHLFSHFFSVLHAAIVQSKIRLQYKGSQAEVSPPLV